MERNSREGSPASGVTAKSQSTVPIPQRIESMIDPAVWGNWAIDLTNASPQQLGSYMGFLLETYEKRNLTGLELWNEVSPDFADWSEEDFQNVPPPILRFFRDHLIGNGVYVEMDGKKISKNVALALKKEEFHYWSPQELEQGVKRYRNLKALIKDPEFHEEITRPATVANSTGGRVEPTLQPPPPQEQQQWQLPYRPPHPTVSPLTDFQPYESTDRIGKQLTEFAKLYPDDMKYSGDMYDVREKKGWTGPFTLAAINGETCTVDTPRGPKTFRSTVVKPYYEDPDQPPNSIAAPEEEEPEAEIPQQEVVRDEIIVAGGGSEPDEPQEAPEPPRRRPGRPRKRPLPIAHFTEEFNDDPDYQQIFLSIKEQADEELAIKLRREGVITTPGEPFEQSTKQEINSLIARGVFKFTQFNKRRHQNVRIFRSRIVNEVKGKTTEPYEKSRLVIQGYADDGKKAILTQSPTIQRASQRLILSITPSLLREGKQLWLRDITQAYVQSSTRLNRTILAYPPKQIQDQYPKGTIMEVVKPLYGIAEAGTHWWATYHKHHRENLQMVTSSYDPCLLISSTENPHFGCIGMQTDDTLGLSDKAFSQLEDEQLEKAAFTAKAKNILTIDEPLQFNGGIIALSTDNSINLRQKGQAKKLRCIETTEPNPKQQYVEQRARGAYIASICQPEACFDLSTAAQHQDPSPEAIKALNQRIRWQIESPNRGITFIPLDLTTAKLFVFVDGSFANNHDLSSQLGFLIILANDTSSDSNNGEFTIHGNLVHYSSTKSKRVTRSVLASEIYGMVAGVDMAYALATTLATITDHLNLPTIQTVVCTDSYSLYECLVKLGTTKEKRLMIDIMALRQSYERRELQEIRWINGEDNPADALTKSKPNRALERFVDSNTITIRMEGWVTRP
ncbi:uncharacterized protein CTRU02_209382 [Colletotrichum truncatum]|uniref:Uncharacterized protein n=1 Tax=Colletotrichum truncatum TaxID=5467 RepID=A0ACC3YTJ0_COLTU